MAKRIIHDGPINTAVMAWMRGQGIKPEDVYGYTLTYNAGDLMTIDIRMYMEDAVPVAMFDADDTPVTLGEVKPIYPARVRDVVDGDEFVHQGDGVYHMVNGGGAVWALDEIGEHTVIEA